MALAGPMRLFAPLCVLLTGCTLSGFEAEIQGRVPFSPPAVYLEWWRDTEACADESGSFEALVFYLADWIMGDARVARARWSEPHDIIIVRRYEADAKVVSHEMLHDLLRGDGSHTDGRWASCDLLFG